MDDSCVVCADTLEWVAYGPCGHRDVCSTCVARLRFICNDRRCCICKTECNVVFVTKALGDYTKMINDFSILPSEVRDGRVEPYWYHEDTQAFFDDLDHYNMIKAMCRLSCSVCDNSEEQHDVFRRRQRFRNIDQLKGHLFHKHRLLMCSLCLEGRKVFICEQKLYSKAQLNRHISTGDSEVDGTESERAGFMGHPICEFCRTPLYGDNELYTHMSTEHYTCHICQRQHPGQYEYYRNYDDLEIHFRQDHFLCEDESCLGKKFIVFQSEAELKRHNALDHGGRMSRSKRNAVLQIPTSFRYQRRNGSGHRQGSGRIFRHESPPDNQLSLAIQASLEIAEPDPDVRFPSLSSSSAGAVAPYNADASDIDPLIQPMESLATSDSEPSSTYLQAVSHHSRIASLRESSFPPLTVTPSSSQQKSEQDLDGLPQNTMVAHLHRQNNVTVLNAAQTWPAASRWPAPSLSSSIQSLPLVNNIPASSSHWAQSNLPRANEPVPIPPSSSYSSFLQTRPVTGRGLAMDGSSRSRNAGNISGMNCSSSASSLVESRSYDPVSDFPPVSGKQSHRSTNSVQAVKVEDIQTANKSLVEKIRAALDNDQDKYTAFRDIAQEYRLGSMDTLSYLDYVKQFGLSHLVLDMARLCPDAQKQKEIVEAYNASLQSKGSQEAIWGNKFHSKEGSGSKKSKGKKVMETGNSRSKDVLADNMISTVKRLQSSYKGSEGEVEVLEKDGYRAAKGKSNVTTSEKPVELADANHIPENVNSQKEHGSTGSATGGQTAGDERGGSKRGKKTSKFHRVRLGDGSSAGLDDAGNSTADPSPGLADDDASGSENPSLGLPVRGAWRKRLFATAPGDSKR
ncbi:hypothetical protein Nepgr_022763 [Nepenthes gracilis]|uniref:RING-type E3 ubiquitin transferase n=1 Tax=Nepenthes gracilis TaxID=150966 RepID=A0AAD3T1J8_NEPGR|nr:hypothetical protein Nepgr_022763 [Nepenthes gracilis]